MSIQGQGQYRIFGVIIETIICWFGADSLGVSGVPSQQQGPGSGACARKNPFFGAKSL